VNKAIAHHNAEKAPASKKDSQTDSANESDDETTAPAPQH